MGFLLKNIFLKSFFFTSLNSGIQTREPDSYTVCVGISFYFHSVWVLEYRYGTNIHFAIHMIKYRDEEDSTDGISS